MNWCRPPSCATRSAPGPQHEVIGVAEHHVGAERLHLIGIHRLHGRGRADRHEGRRADDAARHPDLARARGAVGLGHREGELIGAHTVPAGNLHKGRSESSARNRCVEIVRPDDPAFYANIVPEQQAGVAVGIEAIAAFDGMCIGCAHALQPGKGRNQHEQGRARQVEIGHQDIHGLEAVAGGDEDRGIAGERRDRSILAGGALQEPQGRRANRDDPPAPRPCLVERLRGLRADGAPFRMHPVIGRIVRLHRQEGPRPHMQRHEVAVDAAFVEPAEEIVGEMQAGGGRRDRALVLRIDGLVVDRGPCSSVVRLPAM